MNKLIVDDTLYLSKGDIFLLNKGKNYDVNYLINKAKEKEPSLIISSLKKRIFETFGLVTHKTTSFFFFVQGVFAPDSE